MGSFRDEFLKKNIVSPEHVKELDDAEKHRLYLIKARENHKQKFKDQLGRIVEAITYHPPFFLVAPNPENLADIAMFGSAVQPLIEKHTKGEYKTLRCVVCEASGTSRLETCRAHGEHMKENKDFSWLWDDKANIRFLQSFLDKVGRMLDPVNNIEGVWICCPCKKLVVVNGSVAQKKFCREVFGRYVEPEWSVDDPQGLDAFSEPHKEAR